MMDVRLSRILPYPLFRQLLTVRLFSQIGDGLFQAGLASVILFSPYRAGSVADVALAFAVMLLPFTVVVPFVGPLLDRWDRRRILVWGNCLRAGGVLGLAGLLAIDPGTSAIFVGALLLLGVNRFILAALSAGLPHTLPQRLLVVANSIVPTVGSIAAGCGAAIGFGLTATLDVGVWRDITALLLAGLLFIAASATAGAMRERSLGPREIRHWSAHQIFTQLADGVRYMIAQRTPGYALALMALHRLLYGLSLMMLLVMSRNILVDSSVSDFATTDSGFTVFAAILAVSFIGHACAIVATPFAHRLIGAHLWILVCLALSAGGQLAWSFSYRLPLLFVVFGIFGLSVQGVKISVDTIIQRDTADRYRGRAFSLYDMLFNAALVGSSVLATIVLPISGWSPTVNIGCALAYSAGALIYHSVVRLPH